VVPDKAKRVENFHRNTLKSLRDFSAAAGLSHPREFKPEHFYLHEGLREIMPASVALSWLKKGALLDQSHNIAGYSTYWEMAEAESFHPVKSIEAAKSVPHQ